MGRLVTGATIILFVLVVGVVVSYIKVGSEATTNYAGGCSDGNATACGDPENQSFLDYANDASPADLGDDTPPILNALYLLVLVFLIGMAGLLIALAFIPTTSE